uniref:Interleukin 36 beta n=2 Tax=Callithrix jacchus TaxID=9483 RepID=A0A8I3W263_CALJA
MNPLEVAPKSYVIHDSQKIIWVLSGNSLTTLPFSRNVKPVTLDLIACRDTEFGDEKKGNVVYPGIKGKEFCVFCAEIQGKLILQLNEKNIMDLYMENKAEKPFLFFHNKEGSTSLFQLVFYPGWFIAPSSTSRQPTILTQERGKTNNTNFCLYSVNL